VNGIPVLSMPLLVYSWLGQPTVRFLMDSGGLHRTQAIDFVRRNPAAVDSSF
jgi:hypothetical protein